MKDYYLCYTLGIPLTYIVISAMGLFFSMGRRMTWMPGMKYRVVKVAGSKYFTVQQKAPFWPSWSKCDISNTHYDEKSAWEWLADFLKGDKVMGEPASSADVAVRIEETEDHEKV